MAMLAYLVLLVLGALQEERVQKVILGQEETMVYQENEEHMEMKEHTELTALKEMLESKDLQVDLVDLNGISGINGAPGNPGRQGRSGPRGPNGETGSDGRPGQIGDRGRPGYDGIRGPPGQKGFDGFGGSKGELGPNGAIGEPGARGRDSIDPGKKGIRGEEGDPGSPGVAGDPGQRGPAGPPGTIKGTVGDVGIPGLPSVIRGLPGEPGYDGNNGIPGDPGSEGENGPTGEPGPPGQPVEYFGNYVVRHSQSTTPPRCFPGQKELWRGYSILYVQGHGTSHGQDLGSAGSCLKRFTTMPYLYCNVNDQCNYASRNDYSYWLSTDRQIPMMPISAEAVEPFIGRCVVCESRGPALAVHSQSTQLPICPAGWSPIWQGYSFLMHTGAGGSGSGQSLGSSGSCMETFRPNPFIECHGRGTCYYFVNKYSFWLTTVDRSYVPQQRPETLKAGNILSRVSRCQVCILSSRKKKRRAGPQGLVPLLHDRLSSSIPIDNRHQANAARQTIRQGNS
ncbi:hypothetical protein QZH41_013849 [Actinostola sp. cb2023]|nr:hypothetical protein QZH41_013849 [Actinostola sp. cb2023]